MIYFKKCDDIINKYNIVFDKEKMNDLKNKIINDCSYIKHVEYTGEYEPRFKDVSLIRNYDCTFVRKEEYTYEVRDVYHYEYDEYKPPKLVLLIDRLLNDDITAIDMIVDYNITNEYSIVDEAYKLKEEIEKEKDVTEEKKELLKQLEKDRIVNKNQKNIAPYYIELLEMITYELVDYLSVNDINKIESFLEVDLISNLNNKNDAKKLVLIK